VDGPIQVHLFKRVYEISVLTRKGSRDQVQAGTRRLYKNWTEWKKRWKRVMVGPKVVKANQGGNQ